MNENSFLNNGNVSASVENKEPLQDENINFSLSRGYAFEAKEKRRKRNMLLLFIAAAVLAVTAIVLAVLFTYAENAQNQICSQKYIESVKHINTLIDSVLVDDFDDETKYREIIGELGSARQLILLTKRAAEQKNTINALYFSAIKLPNQFIAKISDIQKALEFILSGNDEQGYSLLNSVLGELDKLDY